MKEIVIIIMVLAIIKNVFVVCSSGKNRSSKKYKNYMINEQSRLFMEQQQREHERWAMEESLKSVTPFEHGGYDMHNGNSFNNFM